MPLKVIVLSEKSQVEKDKYHIFCHLWILDDT